MNINEAPIFALYEHFCSFS